MRTTDGAAALALDPRRLTLARQVAGLKKVDLARLVGVTPAAISQYESGRTRPSSAVAARLALALSFPGPFFEQDKRPYAIPRVSTAHFRSLRAAGQLERQQAAALAALCWEVVHALERHLELPLLGLPDDLTLSPIASSEAVDAAAVTVRERWDAADGPIGHVVRLLESRGIVVVRPFRLSPRVDAFSQWVEDRPLVMLSAEKGDFARSRFDAAHELGHLVLHPDPEPGNRVLERQANRFASEFLMPSEQIANELPRRVDWTTLAALKEKWGVSIQALLYRGKTLGLYSDAAYSRSMATMSRRGWRQHEPGDLGEPERPVLLRRALDLLLDRGYDFDRLADEIRLPHDVLTEVVGAPEGERPRLVLKAVV